MKLTFTVLLTSFIFLGCAHYPSQDYIRYEGIDYGYAHGSKNKIYYRDSGRVTKQTDTIFHFSIGAKKLSEYFGDRELASKTITADIVKLEGFCSKGYKIDYHPTNKTGDFGFEWNVRCK